MCEKCCRCLESDEKAYQDIEALIAQSTPDQVWALHYVSSGSVRENIETAVAALIARGNTVLEAEFPQFAEVSRRKQLQGGQE